MSAFDYGLFVIGSGRVELRDINEGTVEHDRLVFVESDNLFTDLAE